MAQRAVVGSPRLAVLIPVLNGQSGLERSLASLAKDGERFDVFVVDDGSEVPIVVPEGGLPFSVEIIRLDQNLGITAALNAGLSVIAQAGYQYVARLDAGDVSLPGRFAAQLAFLDSHAGHGAIGTAARYVDERGEVVFNYHPPRTHRDLVRFYRYRPGLVHPSVMIRMRALIACGLYNNRFPGAEDYDLIMRMSGLFQIANLEDIFVEKEINQNSITSNRLPMAKTRLRLLVFYFDPLSIHSYLGILSNASLTWAPRPLILRLKRLEGKLHARD
jgi:glycosyltransferase involved in cell wall biosynthesis